MNKKIAIYQSQNGAIELRLDSNQETIWASQPQIAQVYGIDRTRVTRHIANIFNDDEVDEKSNVRKAHITSSGRPVKLYSLDVVLAIGYRTDSKQAIIFRKWSNKILKSYLLHGVAINQKRLDQLNQVLKISSRSEIAEVAGVVSVVKKYAKALTWLEEYDEGKLPPVKGITPDYQLTYQEARKFLDEMDQSKTSDNFARERSDSFKGIIATIYQTFGGQDLYQSVEEKSANLLYLVIKDHPFYDGNKRSAAALFVYFLACNKVANNINNNTLAAIALMVALSKPEEKETIILLIMNFLNE